MISGSPRLTNYPIPELHPCLRLIFTVLKTLVLSDQTETLPDGGERRENKGFRHG